MQMYSLILNLLMLHGRRLVFSLSLLIRTDKKAGVRLITLRQVWCDIPASTVDLFLRPDWNLAATFCFFSSVLPAKWAYDPNSSSLKIVLLLSTSRGAFPSYPIAGGFYGIVSKCENLYYRMCPGTRVLK